MGKLTPIVVIVAAIMMTLAVACGDDGNYATSNFGGSESSWKKTDDGAWVYNGDGPTSIKVPAGWRMDYPGHTCADPTTGGGIYGPATISTQKATLWAVTGESSCPASAVSKDKEPTDAPSGTPALVSTGLSPCPSTTEVNAAVHSDVQRVGGENCAWTLRVAAIGVTGVACPAGYLCTLTVGDTFVYSGDGKTYNGVTAGTVRVIDAYPSGDSVHNPCAHTAKEDNFGAQQNPMFDVLPGNFTCDGGTTLVPNSGPDAAQQSQDNTPEEPAVADQPLIPVAPACPAGTSPLDDRRCIYGPTGHNAALNIPAGWSIEYWDGSMTQTATGPTTVYTGEGTLSPN